MCISLCRWLSQWYLESSESSESSKPLIEKKGAPISFTLTEVGNDNVIEKVEACLVRFFGEGNIDEINISPLKAPTSGYSVSAYIESDYYLTLTIASTEPLWKHRLVADLEAASSGKVSDIKDRPPPINLVGPGAAALPSANGFHAHTPERLLPSLHREPPPIIQPDSPVTEAQPTGSAHRYRASTG